MRTSVFVFWLLVPAAGLAQQPLSAIDWLNQTPPINLPGTVLLEPPVSSSGLQPQIESTPLEALTPPLGLVASNVTGLPVDLWTASDPRRLVDMLNRLNVRSSPAMQTLLFTLLLSETRAPQGADGDDTMLLARLDRLMQMGAVDPTQALVQLAGPTDTKDRFKRWFDATLLTGDEDRACGALIAAPFLSDSYADQIFCQARLGDWQSAALTLETAHALELLTPEELALLDRFLSPDIFEDAPPLPQPHRPDPLTFRLFETIGERLPTTSLPRAFATADLRDVAGWKAQLEAAERLTRIGALTPNHLLGVYTDRQAAASGGVWDRVRAVQRFETALSTGNEAAIGKALTTVWKAMREAQLEVAFAELFADQLAVQRLPDAETASLAWRIRLLAGTYEDAARNPPSNSQMHTFLAALAQGDPGRAFAPNTQAQAIADGFAGDAPLPAGVQRAIESGQLGEAILMAMDLFSRGARGNPADLTAAIATFRSVGLEDTARRAALQLMLLGRG